MPQMRGMASRSLPDSGVRLRAYRDSARWVAAGWASRTEPPPPAGSHAAVCGRGGEPRRAGKVWSGSAAVASRSIETWRWGRDRGADGVWGRLGWFIWFGAWFVWASLVPDNLYPVFHTNNTNAIFFFIFRFPTLFHGWLSDVTSYQASYKMYLIIPKCTWLFLLPVFVLAGGFTSFQDSGSFIDRRRKGLFGLEVIEWGLRRNNSTPQ